MYLSSCRLKKSQSLSDLSPSSKQSLCGYGNAIFYSCPDILELQALSHIHPELSIPMNFDRLHYDADFWKKHRLIYETTNKARKDYRKRRDIDVAENLPRPCFHPDTFEYIDMSFHDEIIR